MFIAKCLKDNITHNSPTQATQVISGCVTFHVQVSCAVQCSWVYNTFKFKMVP
jgi:hypothetical protein